MNADPVDELKRMEPHALKVTLSDGTERPVAVPRVRNRWARVRQVLDAMAWVRIEALDRAGAVVGVVEDDDEVSEMASADAGERDLSMARVLLEVMRSTQKETRQMFETQMRGQAELVEALIAGVKSIATSYEQSMAIERAARVADAAGGQSNPEVMAMIQLALASMAPKPALVQPTKKQEGSK